MWSSHGTITPLSSINCQYLNFPSSSKNAYINNDMEAEAVFTGIKVEETIISSSALNQKHKRKSNKQSNPPLQVVPKEKKSIYRSKSEEEEPRKKRSKVIRRQRWIKASL